ncbi:MAG: hypothetical protein QXS20_08570 [Candidatus Thorarchaeota archaeon]
MTDRKCIDLLSASESGTAASRLAAILDLDCQTTEIVKKRRGVHLLLRRRGGGPTPEEMRSLMTELDDLRGQFQNWAKTTMAILGLQEDGV